MSGEPPPRLRDPRHPFWSGTGGTVAAALIAGVIALVGGGVAVHTGSVPGLPQPTVTQTSTIDAPTVTATATVTVTASPSSTQTTEQAGAVHLADRESRPEGLVLGGYMDETEQVGIDGKTYDFGWTVGLCSYNSTAIDMDINTGQHYKSFTTRLGLQDTGGDGSGKLAVIADGKEVREAKVKVKESTDITLDISGVQRLQIRGYKPSGCVTYALGDPTVSP